MRCFHPLSGFQREDGGSLVFYSKAGYTKSVTVRCGQCIGCRVSRSRMWAVRMMAERQCHDVSSFVTLTYEKLPFDGGLDHRDWQLFAKRLRKQQKFRYFMCGEYGERYLRPHFHAVLFGVGFNDRVSFGMSDSGSEQFTSKRLSALWPAGHAVVGDVSLESCQYVAGYVAKKVTGERANYAYERVDGETGECFYVRPDYCRMSLGRKSGDGIGARWLNKYWKEVAVHNGVVGPGGARDAVPGYFDDLLGNSGRALEIAVLRANGEVAFDFAKDGSVERLAVQEHVALARHNQRKRYVE